MAYKIVVTPDAEADLDGFMAYLLFEKQNSQAAGNLLDDFELTKNTLSNVAPSLKYCENPKLKQLFSSLLGLISFVHLLLHNLM